MSAERTIERTIGLVSIVNMRDAWLLTIRDLAGGLMFSSSQVSFLLCLEDLNNWTRGIIVA